jgi:IS30 family transposase
VAPKREPLTMEDREDISRGLAKGLENKDIASSIGREGYRAWKAHAAARESRSRPKERKIETDPELHERVTGDLKKGWSPIPGPCWRELRRGRSRPGCLDLLRG